MNVARFLTSAMLASYTDSAWHRVAKPKLDLNKPAFLASEAKIKHTQILPSGDNNLKTETYFNRFSFIEFVHYFHFQFEWMDVVVVVLLVDAEYLNGIAK